MIRKLLQSALCIALSPLLAAQQVTTTIVPKDTKIELVTQETVSTETATNGSQVRFAVANDVAINGVTLISAGTPVVGIITKAKRGIAYKQWPTLRIHVNEVRIGQSLRVPLSQWPPEIRQGNWKVRAACIPFFAFCLAMKNIQDNGWGEDGAPKPDEWAGQQAVLPSCVLIDFWTASAIAAPQKTLPQKAASSPFLTKAVCHEVTSWSEAYRDPGLGRVFFR
jgi:hypothetical protein